MLPIDEAEWNEHTKGGVALKETYELIESRVRKEFGLSGGA